jgi:hypothetical protein
VFCLFRRRRQVVRLNSIFLFNCSGAGIYAQYPLGALVIFWYIYAGSGDSSCWNQQGGEWILLTVRVFLWWAGCYV